MALTFGGSNTPGLTRGREESNSTSHVTAEDAGFSLENEWAQDLERGEGKEGAAFRKKKDKIYNFLKGLLCSATVRFYKYKTVLN